MPSQKNGIQSTKYFEQNECKFGYIVCDTPLRVQSWEDPPNVQMWSEPWDVSDPSPTPGLGLNLQICSGAVFPYISSLLSKVQIQLFKLVHVPTHSLYLYN